jgi:hypothetical protein
MENYRLDANSGRVFFILRLKILEKIIILRKSQLFILITISYTIKIYLVDLKKKIQILKM